VERDVDDAHREINTGYAHDEDCEADTMDVEFIGRGVRSGSTLAWAAANGRSATLAARGAGAPSSWSSLSATAK
jgi:hypothetical protein